MSVFSGEYYLQQEQTIKMGRIMCQGWNYPTKVNLIFLLFGYLCNNRPPLIPWTPSQPQIIKPLVQPGKPMWLCVSFFDALNPFCKKHVFCLIYDNLNANKEHLITFAKKSCTPGTRWSVYLIILSYAC